MRSPSIGAVEGSISTHFHPRRPGGARSDSLLVEGLRMSRAYEHSPAMAGEVVPLLATVPAGIFVDATVGGGGHASAVLAANAGLELVGIDRDPAAVAAASAALAPWGLRAKVVHGRFDRLDELVTATAAGRSVTGVLFDLGVSSAQLDVAERGFSYRSDAPLDMRMDRGQSTTAADVVNRWTSGELARIFAANGEVRYASRIAGAVVAARPLSSTAQLAGVVGAAVPAPGRRRGHPARRVFQALRIAVNEELDLLGPAIDAALDMLAPGGRCVVISYHSGEDRLVKERFRLAETGGCTCPPGLPCVCGAEPVVRLLRRGAARPSPAELAANPRASSARLRAVEKLGAAEKHSAAGEPGAARNAPAGRANDRPGGRSR